MLSTILNHPEVTISVWKSKRTGRWVAKFCLDKIRYKKEGFRCRADALQWEAQKRQELKAPMIQIPTASFQEVATEYLSSCQFRLRHNTTRYKSATYRSFLNFVGGDLPFDSVTPKMIADFLIFRSQTVGNKKLAHNEKQNQNPRAGNKAANRDLREINTLYNWAIRHDLIECSNPCKSIDKLPEEDYQAYIPQYGDLLKVMAAANEDERDFIVFISNTLARKIEAAHRLTWDDVDFDRKKVRLFCMRRKGGRLQADDIPMTDVLHRLLKRRSVNKNENNARVFDFTDYALKKMMPRLCAKCGVKEFGFTAIRHLAASIVNDSGQVPVKQIQALMRHRRQTTTENYLRVCDKHLTEAIGTLNAINEKVARNGTPKTNSNEEGSSLENQKARL